jgi:hypothetical protein
MSDDNNKELIEQHHRDLCREEVRRAIEDMRRHDEFHIPRREFYDQHQRIKYFLSAFDSAASTLGKAILGTLVLGIIALLAIGAGWRK